MNTCPHCQAPAREDYPVEFLCGTIRKHRSGICYRNQIAEQAARISNLKAAGQDAVDYIDGKHSMAGRVLDGWRKAKE